MDFLQPTTWSEALAMRAERPDALPIAGGTDVMVEQGTGATTVEVEFDHDVGAARDRQRVRSLRAHGQGLGPRRRLQEVHPRSSL